MTESRYAVLIASSQFHDANFCALGGAVNDVDRLNEILISKDYGNFTETHPLKNETHYNNLEKIEEVFERASKDDLVLLYFAGHGKQDGKGKLYLVTSNTKFDKLKTTSIPLDNIKNIIEDSKTNKVILILDCCLSGLAGKTFLRGSSDVEFESLSSARGTYIMTASTGLQAAREEEKSGIFTKHIIEGIRDWKAANEDGNITIDSLYNYVLNQMIKESFQKPMKWDINVQGDLVIARRGKSKRKENADSIRAAPLEIVF